MQAFGHKIKGMNQIAQLNASSIGVLPSLETLSLQRNRLSDLADGTFKGLTGLKRLNLAIRELEAGENSKVQIHPTRFQKAPIRFFHLSLLS